MTPKTRVNFRLNSKWCCGTRGSEFLSWVLPSIVFLKRTILASKKAALLSLAYCIMLYIGGVCLSLSITNGRVSNEHFIIIWGRVPPQNRNCIEILHFWVFQHPFLISWKFEDFSSRTLEVMTKSVFFLQKIRILGGEISEITLMYFEILDLQ